MKKRVMQMWVKALRSGGYPQTCGQLRDEQDGVTHYCCLGVLCDLHSQHGRTGSWQGEVYTDTARGMLTTSLHYDVPTKAVIAWAGLKSPNPKVLDTDPGQGETIAELNDSDGWTFDQLADLIEERWEVM
jgi:hypothetical protein